MTDEDPGRIGWELGISGAWPLPKDETGPVCNCRSRDLPGSLCYVHGMREHTDYGWCWCQPTTVDVPPDGEVIVHRRTADE